MTALASAEPDLLSAIRATLAEKPDGVLEAVAAAHGAPLLTVVEALPEAERLLVPAERFEAIWDELTSWGEVLFLMHTPSVVLEVVGRLPPGTHGRGWFNIHGDGPIGGHIRADACRAIAFVDRIFHGRRSCSIQVFDEAGASMFKIFVRRGPDRALDEAQLARFEALRARLASS